MIPNHQVTLLHPRALRAGARVALVAPAGPIEPERIERSLERCRQLSLEPVLFPAATRRYRYLAGTDEQRAGDLQAAFDDAAIDAVWGLRGGYGSGRLLERLDLSRQRRDPIPFIGFSDNTALHARHTDQGVVSFHAPHPGGDFPTESEASFRRTLFEPEPAGALRTAPGDPAPRALTPGRVEAPLVGGNLSIVASLCGTRDALSARDRILFLEELNEPAYRVDRMLVQLQRAGTTDGLRGLAFGRFLPARDDDHPILECLSEFAERLGVPAVAELPFGHVPHNSTLPVGCSVLLDADEARLVVTEAAVTTGDGR